MITTPMILSIIQIVITAGSTALIMREFKKLIERYATTETSLGIFQEQNNKNFAEIKKEQQIADDNYYKLDKKVNSMERDIDTIKQELKGIKDDLVRKN